MALGEHVLWLVQSQHGCEAIVSCPVALSGQDGRRSRSAEAGRPAAGSAVQLLTEACYGGWGGGLGWGAAGPLYWPNNPRAIPCFSPIQNVKGFLESGRVRAGAVVRACLSFVGAILWDVLDLMAAS